MMLAMSDPAAPSLPAEGTVRPMTRWGDAVMHRPARRVTDFDESLRALVADMVATMYAAEGVGLAACQIGVDLAVFVFDCFDEDGTPHRGVVCNPELDLPEGTLPMTQAVAYLSLAPKSNAVITAYGKAKETVQETGTLPVPPHLRPASTPLMKSG